MAHIVEFKPTTPTRRHTKLLKVRDQVLPGAEAAVERAHKQLLGSVRYNAGKNNRGVITTRHKGGMVKRAYRNIDFARLKKDIVAEVISIEYDPNRTANVALLKYADGELRYIIAPQGLELGAKVVSSETVKSLQPGNSYPLKSIPAATFVHNVEIVPGKGGVIARGAGAGVQIQGKADKGYIQIKLPSGEIRLVKEDCYATIGMVGNEAYTNVKIGKAGRKRKMGVRPTVRGVAQSYKHPHAGGQGKSGRHGTGGPSKDPWGNKRGKITRKRKLTNKFIIKRRTSTLRPKNKPYKTIA